MIRCPDGCGTISVQRRWKTGVEVEDIGPAETLQEGRADQHVIEYLAVAVEDEGEAFRRAHQGEQVRQPYLARA